MTNAGKRRASVSPEPSKRRRSTKMNRRGVLHYLGLAGRRRGPPVPLSLMAAPSLF
jgi:hypothetical protein